MKTHPTLLSWLTCDAVHVDPSTGKHTYLGVFTSLNGKRMPFNVPSMVWSLVLTDCSTGDHKLRISMGENPADLRPLLERPFTALSPSQRVCLLNELKNLHFAKSGDYAILIEIDEEPLLVTSLLINGP